MSKRSRALAAQELVDADAATGTGTRPVAGELLGLVLATVDGILVLGTDGRVHFANPAASRVLGRTAEELAELPFGLPLPRPDDRAELDVLRPDGTVAVVEMHVAESRWKGKRARVVTLRDVTDRVNAERRTQRSEERYALSARAANDGLWDWDLSTGRVFHAARVGEILGCGTEDHEEDIAWCWEQAHPDDLASVRTAIDDLLSGRAPRIELECRMRAAGRSWLWVLIRAVAVIEDGRARRCVGSITDIDERKHHEEELRRRASHDPLTGLGNSALFLDRLQGAIGRHARDGRGFAVLFLDHDRFKDVNDSLGHAAGDEVLVEVARRVEGAVRETDTVVRIGGDEFAVLLDNPDGLETTLTTAERIRSALAAPLFVESRLVDTAVSIGIALSDRHPSDAEAVLHEADVAMYRAKAQGRNRYEVFVAGMDAEPALRLRQRTELAGAAEAGDLFVRYQPVVDLDEGRIVGFEALLRWRLGSGEVRDAADFIDLAEETGVVVPVGWDVLGTACRQAGAWHHAGFAVSVAVNLSGLQLAASDLVEHVAAALDDAGIDGSALHLEVNERSAMTDVGFAAGQLTRCRELGVGVVMDDIGAGSSSLAAVHALPLSGLKIDRSLVERLDDGDAGDLVRAVVALAAGLGLEVVAEGIETPAQRAHLHRLGCAVGQGYLFGASLDADEATRLLRAQPGPPGQAPVTAVAP